MFGILVLPRCCDPLLMTMVDKSTTKPKALGDLSGHYIFTETSQSSLWAWLYNLWGRSSISNSPMVQHQIACKNTCCKPPAWTHRLVQWSSQPIDDVALDNKQNRTRLLFEASSSARITIWFNGVLSLGRNNHISQLKHIGTHPAKRKKESLVVGSRMIISSPLISRHGLFLEHMHTF